MWEMYENYEPKEKERNKQKKNTKEKRRDLFFLIFIKMKLLIEFTMWIGNFNMLIAKSVDWFIFFHSQTASSFSRYFHFNRFRCFFVERISIFVFLCVWMLPIVCEFTKRCYSVILYSAVMLFQSTLSLLLKDHYEFWIYRHLHMHTHTHTFAPNWNLIKFSFIFRTLRYTRFHSAIHNERWWRWTHCHMPIGVAMVYSLHV